MKENIAWKKKLQKKADEEPVLQKITIREAEPATITALAYNLGFNSREEFDALEKTGRYSAILKRARLKVEAAYEQRLLQSSPTGAMQAYPHPCNLNALLRYWVT